jgi:hypothetical protein
MLWEVLCTLTAQRTKGGASSALRVRLPPAESDDFQAALVNEFDVIAASVARIDSRLAECFTLEDQAMVHAAIDRTLKDGHTELDARLSEALRKWLAAEGRAALARMPCEERATLALQNQLGMLLHAQGKLDEAEDNMNLHISNCTKTAKDGRVSTLASVFLRGSHVRFMVLPDILKNAPFFKKIETKQAKQAQAKSGNKSQQAAQQRASGRRDVGLPEKQKIRDARKNPNFS